MIDIMGVVGALLVLFAFYRIALGQWTSRSVWYELDNLVGAALLGYYTWSKGAYISVLINLVWFMVAIVGLRSIHERHPKLAKKLGSRRRGKRR